MQQMLEAQQDEAPLAVPEAEPSFATTSTHLSRKRQSPRALKDGREQHVPFDLALPCGSPVLFSSLSSIFKPARSRVPYGMYHV